MRQDTPHVSIVVTCYNYGKYVSGCLNSILNQTFENYEVIVIDDGSTDDSQERIQPFLKDKRFRYVKQSNKGQARAKNRGIDEARGDLIAFLDADDLWEPYKLEHQLPLFDQKGVGVVYSGLTYINEEGEISPRGIVSQYLRPRRGDIANYLIYDNFIPFSSAVVKRECFELLGAFNEALNMGIDWDLWLRISTQFKFEYCDRNALLYRTGHSYQMSRNLLERFRCADIITQNFILQFPDAVSLRVKKDALYYSCCLRGYTLRSYGYPFIWKNYFNAIRLFPSRAQAYIGLIKTTGAYLVSLLGGKNLT